MSHSRPLRKKKAKPRTPSLAIHDLLPDVRSSAALWEADLGGGSGEL
jgi:hypothetical protein